jgi:hypothetical protein
VLYEDELADNGIAILSVKIRVHPERLFVLSRFYLRLDGVLVRVRDTRVFVEFATGEVLREYQAREETYANVRNVSFPSLSLGGVLVVAVLVLVLVVVWRVVSGADGLLVVENVWAFAG